MIRRSTVVYITILLAIVAVYLTLSSREQSAEPEATSGPTKEVSYLFPAEQGSPIRILIRARSGETVDLARNSEGAWAVRQPVESLADQGLSEAAAGQVVTLRILEKITNIDLELVGLEEPAYTLTVEFDNGTERTARIGVVTPTESGYYVQNSDEGDVLIISKSSVDALLGLLTTPPFRENLTPSPLPIETGTAPTTTPSTP